MLGVKQLTLGRLLPATLLVLGGAGNAAAVLPSTSRAMSVPGDEAAWAREVLDASRGATRILCGLATRALEARYGMGPWTPPAAVVDSSGAMAWALDDRRGAAAIAVLLSGLNETDGCVRAVASRLIAQATSQTAMDGLVHALAAPMGGTRAAAAVALGLGDHTMAVDPLIDRLGDEDAAVRAASAWALGGLEDARAVTPLRRTLSDRACRSPA